MPIMMGMVVFCLSGMIYSSFNHIVKSIQLSMKSVVRAEK